MIRAHPGCAVHDTRTGDGRREGHRDSGDSESGGTDFRGRLDRSFPELVERVPSFRGDIRAEPDGRELGTHPHIGEFAGTLGEGTVTARRPCCRLTGTLALLPAVLGSPRSSRRCLPLSARRIQQATVGADHAAVPGLLGATFVRQTLLHVRSTRSTTTACHCRRAGTCCCAGTGVQVTEQRVSGVTERDLLGFAATEAADPLGNLASTSPSGDSLIRAIEQVIGRVVRVRTATAVLRRFRPVTTAVEPARATGTSGRRHPVIVERFDILVVIERLTRNNSTRCSGGTGHGGTTQ